MAISLIRKLSLTESQVKALYLEILEIPALRGKIWDITSPEIIEAVMIKITEATGDPDPFVNEKNRLNHALMELYPVFQDRVETAADPIYTAAALAIAGNAIDFMVPQSTRNAEDSILKSLEAPIPKKWFSRFEQKLNTAKSILYFGDNTGEVVLDKLFIETLIKQYDLKIVFVVRSLPALNDVTLKEAVSVGLDSLVDVIENGVDGPLPGTILGRCADETRALVEKTDLIISKGGGNYDSLGEEKKYLNKIVFMLVSKCYPYNRDFGVDLFAPILSVAS